MKPIIKRVDGEWRVWVPLGNLDCDGLPVCAGDGFEDRFGDYVVVDLSNADTWPEDGVLIDESPGLQCEVEGLPEPIEDDLAVSIVGEGMHTALRKGTDAPGAMRAHHAIRDIGRARDIDCGGWSQAVRWFIGSLDYMGCKICKVPGDE